MVVSQSIYSKGGGSYLVKGQPLTIQYIQRLKKIGIPSVSVTSTNPNFHLMPPADIVQETTRIDAIQQIFDAFQNVEHSGQLDVDAVQNVSDHILFDVIQRRENLVQLTDIRLHDTYTFAHSVNVAILSAMLGLLCHYTKQDLALLTLGALLHDLGKIKISSKILNKTSRLNNEEFTIIQNHPMEGARRIREMGTLLPSPGLLAAIAAQHHEHVDGKGYPQHLTDAEIHRFSKIVAIADVYDALTSERPYKKAYTPSITHNIMVNVNKGQFDEELLRLFFNNVALYPVGTILKTTRGFAIVTKCEFGHTERPSICIFADLQGKVLSEAIRLDLKEDPDCKIEMELSGIELLHFVHELSVDPFMYLVEE